MLQLPIPTKKPSGTDITSAQGQDTTKKINALFKDSEKLIPNNGGNDIAISIAITITTGVYVFENLVIKFSVLDLISFAFSINSIILDAVESTYSFVTLTSIILPILIIPDNTSSFFLTLVDILSPVKLDVSSLVSPFEITPSVGIFSPFFTTTISPIFKL